MATVTRALATVTMLIVVTLTLSNCGSTEISPPGNESVKSMKDRSSMEAVGNPVYKDNNISMTVISNGCTRLSDFIVEHDISMGRCELTIVRTREDLCRRARSATDVEIKWSLQDDCNGMEVIFMNPGINE